MKKLKQLKKSTQGGLIREIILRPWDTTPSYNVKFTEVEWRTKKFNHCTNSLRENNNKWVAQSILCLSVPNPTPHGSVPILMRRRYGQDSRLGSERVANVITECNIYVWPAGLQGFDWPPSQPMNGEGVEAKGGINTSNEEAAVRG